MTLPNFVAASLRTIVRPAVARSVLALVVGLLILAPIVSQSAVDARPALGPDASTEALTAGSRIRYLGRDWYLHGANVPWLNWAADFGGGTGNHGVTSSASQTALNDAFQQAKDSGVTNIRWWVFEGDPWQIRRDGSGAPTSLDPAIYPDFDAAVALAETYDLYLDFVLFSAPSHLPASWLSNATQRNQLGTVLEPLLARYAGNPRVMTWEVFNGPCTGRPRRSSRSGWPLPTGCRWSRGLASTTTRRTGTTTCLAATTACAAIRTVSIS